MKTKLFLILIVLFSIISGTKAQTFIASDIEFIGLHFSIAEWADFNADGYMDLIISGVNNSNNEELFLYQNNGDNTISEVMIPAPALYYGDIAWGNFDNDEDIDFSMMGLTTDGNDFSMLYENTDGNSFQENSLSLPMRSVGSCSFVDFNNDGFLDIFLSGNTGQINSAHLFKNNGDKTFSEISTNFPGLSGSSIIWTDFDNDGDFDVFLSGQEVGGANFADIFENNGDETFTATNNSFSKFFNGDASCGDYNSDGYDDIIITGDKEGTYICELYKNNGNGTFSVQTTDFNGLAYSTIDWGDFDNDGDLDILHTGCNLAWQAESSIYINNGDETFTATPVGLTESFWGAADCADFDGDNDLDLIISGYNALWSGNTIIYINQTENSNTIPEAPANLSEVVNGSSVEMSWDAANDNETPSAGLTYNLYLYNSTTGDTIMTSMSNKNSGKLYVPKFGNTGHNTSWTINNLPNGEYFWSVQAVDNSYAGSFFTEENSFTINEVAIDEVDETSVEVYPNPANEKIFFNQKTNNKIKINIYNSQGVLVDVITTEKIKTECTIDHLKTGIYFYKIISKNNSTSGSFIKK